MDKSLSNAGDFVSALNAVSPTGLVFFALVIVFLALVVLLKKL